MAATTPVTIETAPGFVWSGSKSFTEATAGFLIAAGRLIAAGITAFYGAARRRAR